MKCWHPSPVFPDRYMVSDQGDVISLERKVFCKAPNGQVAEKWLPAKRIKHAWGGRNWKYKRVQLHGENGKRVFAYVHVLICEAFHGPRPAEALACHKNDNSTDNRAENLYWGTRAENENDRAINNLSESEAPELVGDPW